MVGQVSEGQKAEAISQQQDENISGKQVSRITRFVIRALTTFVILGGFVFSYFTAVQHMIPAIWTLYVTVVILLLDLYLYLVTELWPSFSKRKQLSGIIILLGAVLLLPLFWWWAKSFEPVKPSADLLGLDQPIFTEKAEEGTLLVTIGNNHYPISFKTLETSRVPLPFHTQMSDYNPIYFYAENNRPMIDVKIWGGPKVFSVDIERNQFVVRPLGWDRNSSKNGLEIVNEKTEPILQLYYENPAHLVINGVFPSPEGVLYATENGVMINPPSPPSLKRLYKYLSWKYPGQYADDNQK